MKRIVGWARAFPWGEACLWVLFLVTGLSAASESSETTMTLAGLFLLAAIGVRATRASRSENDSANS